MSNFSSARAFSRMARQMFGQTAMRAEGPAFSGMGGAAARAFVEAKGAGGSSRSSGNAVLAAWRQEQAKVSHADSDRDRAALHGGGHHAAYASVTPCTLCDSPQVAGGTPMGGGSFAMGGMGGPAPAAPPGMPGNTTQVGEAAGETA